MPLNRMPFSFAALQIVRCCRYYEQKKDMSPTVFNENGYRFFFFSREESRVHIHVISADGEAKFWLEPEIECKELSLHSKAPERNRSTYRGSLQ